MQSGMHLNFPHKYRFQWKRIIQPNKIKIQSKKRPFGINWYSAHSALKDRSRNSENKTTEKCAVSYLFVYKRFKVRLFTAQVLLIFYLLLRRKIVFKSWLYNHADKILRWWMKCSERKTKEKNHVTILNYIWLAGDFARLENRALFDSFR